MSKARRIITFIIISMAAGCIFFAPCLKYTFYDQMLAVLSLDDVQINMCYSVYAFVCLICYPVSGCLADKLPIRLLVGVSLIADAVVVVVYSFTTSYPALLVIHGLLGFFASATFWCPYLKAVRMLGTEGSQSKMFGISEAVRALAQAVIGFAAVWVLGSFASLNSGFQWMLWMTAAIYVVLAILVIILLPREGMGSNETAAESAQEATQEAPAEKAGFGVVLKNPGTWICVLLIISGFCAWLLANTFLTTYTVRVLGISQDMASSLGIVRSYLLIVIAGLGGGWLFDKISYKGKTFLVTFALTAIVTLGIMGTSQVVAVCIALTLVMTLLVSTLRSCYWSILGQAGIPAAITGTATGIISFVAYLPESFITVICGQWIQDAAAAGNIETGFTMVFMLIIAFCVTGCVASILLLRRTKSLESKVFRSQEQRIQPQ